MNKIEKIKLDIQLLYFLTNKEFKIRYKNSLLGYLWALLNPLAFAVVYYFAFKLIMRFDVPNYGLVLMTGIFPWQWINNSLVKGTTSYVQNSSSIRKVSFNYNMIPLSMVTHDMIHFILALPIIFIFMHLSEMNFHLTYLWGIPMLLLMQFSLLAPLVTLFSTLNVFVRDIEYLITVIITLLFFLTPIVYPIDIVPENYLYFYKLNPFMHLIESWRALLLDGIINYKIIFIYYLISIISYFLIKKICKAYYKKFIQYL
jgi:lipopolysaccharide transport system permease protein